MFSKKYSEKYIDEIIKNWVDIKGVDRKELLLALWNNAKPCIGYQIKVLSDDTLPDTDYIDIDKVIKDAKKDHGLVDYAFGRFIKIYLFDDKDMSNIINSTRYDEEWGHGSVQRIVNQLKL